MSFISLLLVVYTPPPSFNFDRGKLIRNKRTYFRFYLSILCTILLGSLQSRKESSSPCFLVNNSRKPTLSLSPASLLPATAHYTLHHRTRFLPRSCSCILKIVSPLVVPTTAILLSIPSQTKISVPSLPSC